MHTTHACMHAAYIVPTQVVLVRAALVQSRYANMRVLPTYYNVAHPPLPIIREVVYEHQVHISIDRMLQAHDLQRRMVVRYSDGAHRGCSRITSVPRRSGSCCRPTWGLFERGTSSSTAFFSVVGSNKIIRITAQLGTTSRACISCMACLNARVCIDGRNGHMQAG